MPAQPTWVIGMLLIAGLVFGSASAPVWAQGHFGISAGLYQPEEDEADRTEVFGLRGGYRFRPNFGFEGSLSRVDLADAFPDDDEPPLPGFDFDLQLDLYNLDLTLQWFPRGGDFVVFGGPGVARLDGDIRVTFFGFTVTDSATSDIFTAHAGLGYQWWINDRFFIRPEARVRRYFDDELEESDVEEDDFAIAYKSTDYEAGVTFGWRFGS